VDLVQLVLNPPGAAATPRVGVALSGGPDSTAALALCAAARDRRGGFLAALHVDHGLRPDSGRDAAAAEAAAARLAVPCEVVRVVVPGDRRSPEGPARDARYAALAAWAERLDLSHVVVAHSREDRIENVLLALLRGGGFRALAAPRPLRTLVGRRVVWRPFLDVPRAQLRAAAAGLPWVDDPTNADPTPRRNALRLDLLPRLRAVRPDFDDAVLALGRAAAEIDAATDAAVLRLCAAPDAHREPGLVAIGRAAAAAAGRLAVSRAWLDAFEADPLLGGPLSGAQMAELVAAAEREEPRTADVRRGVALDIGPAGATAYALVPTPVPAASGRVPDDAPLELPCGPGRTLRVARLRDATTPALDDPRSMLLFAPNDADFVVTPVRRDEVFVLETGAGTSRVWDVVKERGVPRPWRARVPVVRVNGAVRWIVGVRRVGAALGPQDVAAYEMRLVGPAGWV
jgi:tRNA(Ile)-lysidine synthetase-like protein